MLIGKRDRRIILKNLATIRNEYGEEVEHYVPIGGVFANVNERQASRESFQAQRETATRQAIFNIRYRSDINEMSRIEYNGWDYDIISMAEIGRRQEWEIRAEAKEVAKPVPIFDADAVSSSVVQLKWS